MIDMKKLEKKFELLEAALIDLNEIEKDLTLQQFIAKLNKLKQKQKKRDLVGDFNLDDLRKRFMG